MKTNSWERVNKILEGFKKFPLFRFLYKISWAPRVYHFFLALAGALIYCFPSKKIKVIGVTGTKGKSTTVELISFFLEKAGYKTAFFSSVHIKIGDEIKKNRFGNSSPGRFFLQYFLRRAVNNDCRYAIVEMTSQGILLYRHRFIAWDGAVFLNIHPEHIEAHGSFEKYLDAKLSFFRYAAKSLFGKFCRFFVNKDDKHARDFIDAADGEKTILFSGKGINLKSVILPDGLLGNFNRENIAAAWAVVKSENISEDILKFLEKFRGVEGRMDFIQKEPFGVVVDYAHTPDSLEAVYQTLSSYKKKSGRLICVLGSCGGGRDRWKRMKMGEIAARHCDFVVLTNEDPYSENPLTILEEIEKGLSQILNSPATLNKDLKAGSRQGRDKFQIPNKNYWKILDRKEAIKKAVSLAKGGDVVVCTGKGSEQSIHIAGGKIISWSEKGVVGEILNKN